MARDKYSENLKNEIINDYFKGSSQIELARKHKINKSIISRLVKKYKTTKSVKTLHLGGAPRKTDERADRHIVQTVQKYPFKSSTAILNDLNLNVSSRTVRRRVLKAGFRSFRPAKKPMLTKKHLAKR